MAGTAGHSLLHSVSCSSLAWAHLPGTERVPDRGSTQRLLKPGMGDFSHISTNSADLPCYLGRYPCTHVRDYSHGNFKANFHYVWCTGYPAREGRGYQLPCCRSLPTQAVLPQTQAEQKLEIRFMENEMFLKKLTMPEQLDIYMQKKFKGLYLTLYTKITLIWIQN